MQKKNLLYCDFLVLKFFSIVPIFFNFLFKNTCTAVNELKYYGVKNFGHPNLKAWRRFYNESDCIIWVQPPTGHVIACLDKAFYDDYLCLLASSKQQTQ